MLNQFGFMRMDMANKFRELIGVWQIYFSCFNYNIYQLEGDWDQTTIENNYKRLRQFPNLLT